MKYVEKLKHMLVVLLLPMVSYGLLGPLEIFFGNQKDFSFRYTDFFIPILLLALLIWIAAGALLALLSKRIEQLAAGLILGIGVASYIQNMFLNIKLSEDDGSPMRWEELGNFPIIDLIIWIVILFGFLGAAIFLKKQWKPISMAVAGFLSVIQLVAVLSLILTAKSGQQAGGEVQMSGKEQFQVAKDDNIIVFVLDTYGTEQLETALEEYPDMLEGLEDFTYYNNADCHYYCTFPSMTHMLTGAEFDFNTSSEEWLSQSWQSERAEKFYNTLKEDGYLCNLYSGETGYVYGDLQNLEGKFDNIRHMESVVDKKQLVKLMAKMSIYRYTPYVVKPYFEVLTLEFDSLVSYMEDEGIIDDNATFYQKLTSRGLTDSLESNQALIIQHLFGTHKPYTLDENAGLVEEAEVSQTARGLFVIIDEYLSQLKQLGVYDDATIIITADHGSWWDGDTQPIMFLKQKGEQHDIMQINSSPVSADDFQATILAILGEDTSEYGTSIFEWHEGDTRERTVYMRVTDENYPSVEGSSFNAYYSYTYLTDKTELNQKVAGGPEEILPATPW